MLAPPIRRLTTEPRFQHGADHHSLRAPALGHFLAGLAEHHGIVADTAELLDEWRRRLSPELVAADGIWAPPI
jgi:hypothetical protein